MPPSISPPLVRCYMAANSKLTNLNFVRFNRISVQGVSGYTAGYPDSLTAPSNHAAPMRLQEVTTLAYYLPRNSSS